MVNLIPGEIYSSWLKLENKKRNDVGGEIHIALLYQPKQNGNGSPRAIVVAPSNIISPPTNLGNLRVSFLFLSDRNHSCCLFFLFRYPYFVCLLILFFVILIGQYHEPKMVPVRVSSHDDLSLEEYA